MTPATASRASTATPTPECLSRDRYVAFARSNSGLALMNAVRSGRLSLPALEVLGAVFEEVAAGRVVISLNTKPEHHNNYMGTVHGGVLATLIDTAAGCAVQTTLAKGKAYTGASLCTEFLARVDETTPRIKVIGTVEHHGMIMPLGKAEIVVAGSKENKRLATGTLRCLVRDL